MKSFRIHLRHTGVEQFAKPQHTNLHKLWGGRYWGHNFLLGRWYLVVRRPDPRRDTGFFDLEMGRAMLKSRREEDACTWSGTDHYYGLCGCPNKRSVHPRFVDDEHIFLFNKHFGVEPWNTVTDEHVDRAASSFDDLTRWAKEGGAPDNYTPETIFFLATWRETDLN